MKRSEMLDVFSDAVTDMAHRLPMSEEEIVAGFESAGWITEHEAKMVLCYHRALEAVEEFGMATVIPGWSDV